MTIYAKIIADSKGPGGRITSLELQYQRFIHSEVMTHRVFSRNAMSSRAIPVEKMIAQVRENPAAPIHWGANQPGMQASAQLVGDDLQLVKHQWKLAAERAADSANIMRELGAHKQVVNRILEPFQWMRTIVTATEWDNFFELRDHPDAQPEFRALAQAIRQAMGESKPKTKYTGEWHLPYVREDEQELLNPEILPKISAARCARVSYLTHDGENPDVKKDLDLFNRLVGARPLHASPIEHQARAMSCRTASRNFRGWEQFRSIYEAKLGV